MGVLSNNNDTFILKGCTQCSIIFLAPEKIQYKIHNIKHNIYIQLCKKDIIIINLKHNHML